MLDSDVWGPHGAKPQASLDVAMRVTSTPSLTALRQRASLASRDQLWREDSSLKRSSNLLRSFMPTAKSQGGRSLMRQL